MQVPTVRTLTICGKTTPAVYHGFHGTVGSFRNAKTSSVRFRGDTISFKWFPNGSFQCTGAKSLEDIRDYVSETFQSVCMNECKIAMMYMTFLGNPRNLMETRNQLCTRFPFLSISYDWDRFKGLIVKDPHNNTFLLYKSGFIGAFGKNREVLTDRVKEYFLEYSGPHP
jgi:TATA-box binding protein (TBP) (component of TFIID and TFIIIB)